MGAEPRDAADAPVRPGCWLACDNRPGRAAHMVTAVHGGRVWFGDREPLHVGFLSWWRIVDPPSGKGGKARSGARSSEAGKDSIIGRSVRQVIIDDLGELSEALQ